LKKIVEERKLATRFRQAVQYCKEINGYSNIMTDHHMGRDDRMKMERCLTQNFLLKYGMDVFGKRDLLFIDMRGNKDVAKMYNMEELPDPRQPKSNAKAAAGGDDGGDEAVTDDAGGNDAGNDEE
jgi:hypothetical protein